MLTKPESVRRHQEHTGDRNETAALYILAAVAEWNDFDADHRNRSRWPDAGSYVRRALGAHDEVEAAEAIVWAFMYWENLQGAFAGGPFGHVRRGLWTALKRVTQPADRHHGDRPTAAAIDQMIDATAATLAAGPTPALLPQDPEDETPA
jgi:hypothetical protein